MGIEKIVQDEQVPEVQDKGYGQKFIEYAKWPLIAGGVLWFSLFGAPQKDMKDTVIRKSGQTLVTENNYAHEALDGIVNGLQSAGVNNVNAGGLDYQSMAEKMEELNQQEKYQQVINQYKEFADDKGNESALFYNELSGAYFGLENGKKAVEYCKKCLEVGGNDPIMYFNLGQSYLKLGVQSDNLSIALKAMEPFQTYLEKGGTTNDRDDYVTKKLNELQNFKNDR